LNCAAQINRRNRKINVRKPLQSKRQNSHSDNSNRRYTQDFSTGIFDILALQNGDGNSPIAHAERV
jgi:hypothetical protein